jgi:hypothetical protein
LHSAFCCLNGELPFWSGTPINYFLFALYPSRVVRIGKRRATRKGPICQTEAITASFRDLALLMAVRELTTAFNCRAGCKELDVAKKP